MSRPKKPTPKRTERELLAWLRARPETASYLGDDAAILEEGGAQVITVDIQIAGVHVPEDIEPATFARRLLAVNLSDLAAMGARPTHGLLALAAPPEFELQRFFEAFLHACRSHGTALAGGDLSRSPRLMATLTLIGRRWPGGEWVRRSSAEAGQVLWLGGTVGESALGCHLAQMGGRLSDSEACLPDSVASWPRHLAAAARRALSRHLEPQPQLELGRWLSTQRAAATDLSDGLAIDLQDLCVASGIGAQIQETALPGAKDFDELARHLDLDPLHLKLAGGEDYVLLLTLPDGVSPPKKLGCRPIGRATEGSDLSIVDGRGQSRPLPAVGWDHFS